LLEGVVLRSGESDFGVRPLSLHLRQPSLTATAAHLPVEPAKHPRHVDGDGVRVRENFCVVWRCGGGGAWWYGWMFVSVVEESQQRTSSKEVSKTAPTPR
jgi:hypothetical protein